MERVTVSKLLFQQPNYMDVEENLGKRSPLAEEYLEDPLPAEEEVANKKQKKLRISETDDEDNYCKFNPIQTKQKTELDEIGESKKSPKTTFTKKRVLACLRTVTGELTTLWNTKFGDVVLTRLMPDQSFIEQIIYLKEKSQYTINSVSVDSSTQTFLLLNSRNEVLFINHLGQKLGEFKKLPTKNCGEIKLKENWVVLVDQIKRTLTALIFNLAQRGSVCVIQKSLGFSPVSFDINPFEKSICISSNKGLTFLISFELATNKEMKEKPDFTQTKLAFSQRINSSRIKKVSMSTTKEETLCFMYNREEVGAISFNQESKCSKLKETLKIENFHDYEIIGQYENLILMKKRRKLFLFRLAPEGKWMILPPISVKSKIKGVFITRNGEAAVYCSNCVFLIELDRFVEGTKN